MEEHSDILITTSNLLNRQITHQRLFQIASRAGEAGFDGSNRNAQDIGDFVVGEPFDVAKHDDRSMLSRESPKSLLYGSLLFLRLQNLFGRRTRASQAVPGTGAVAVRLIVQRDGGEAMPPLPPAQAIQNLRKSDLE